MLPRSISATINLFSVRQSTANTRNIIHRALPVALAMTAIFCVRPANALTDARSFFTGITGEWVGTCLQSTNGKQADNKYFHAVIKQVSASTFNSSFEYYRIDDTSHNPIKIGTSSIITTIGPNGIAQNQISGKGIMMVDYKPKEQTHNFKETLTVASNGLLGQGSGSLSVSGMPFGLGKNGRISKATSAWTFDGNNLTIRQTITAGFKALFFSKNFDVVAQYTAKRGSNLASIMGRPLRTASRTY